MKSYIYSGLAAIVILITTSCTNSSVSINDPIVSNIDSSIKPGDDFFLYANGNWFKQHPIPASENSNGLWQIIQDTINAQIKNICVSASIATNEDRGSNKQKIGDFYYSGMDSSSLNNNKLNDLKSYFDQIDNIKTTNDLMKVAAVIHMEAAAPLFSFFIAQDDKISDKYAVQLWQGGLSLPDRAFYFDNDERAKEVRSKFIQHVQKMFVMMGYSDKEATANAQNLMDIEISLAQSSRKLEDLRNPLENYHKQSFVQFEKQTPDIAWTVFFGNVGLNQIDTLIVGQPEFFTDLNNKISQTPIEQWKLYLKYHLIIGLSSYLDDNISKEAFSFYGTVLQGVTEQKPRWERVVGKTDGSLGELIGQVYVSEYLPEGTKEKLQEIGGAVKEVFTERIKNLDWMSEATKIKALKKLDAIIFKVGYPDQWKDLSRLQVDRSSYVKNVLSANRWEMEFMVAKFGKPVDRTEWHMTPQTYNAYYNPSNNEIVIPGCNIMLPGFERRLADDALLYAVIGGSTFAHEITHGFDDQGCKYDEKGNLRNWWLTEDSIRFFEKTKLIVSQFDNYVAVDSLHINGSQTQGENIADLAGVVMGYEAFKKTKQFNENQIISGLNPSERFFLGYAFAWMINERPELTANRVRSDVHSPPKFRVIGPLSNIPEFYETFNVKPDDKMWRADSLRVEIW